MREESQYKVVGRSWQRKDGLAKVLGTARFVADQRQDDMLVGKVLWARYPHARIKRVDTSKAEDLPGVRAVVTAKDIPGINGFGVFVADQPVVAEDKVRYLGDAVALVAADTEDIALAALKLIEVDYEQLPAVFDPVAAMAEDAPLVHEKPKYHVRGNILSHYKVRKGNIDQGFAEADIIVEGTYRTPFVEHAYLEPDACIAIPNPDGSLTIIGAMQAPFTTRRSLAPVFGLPFSKLRVVAPLVGGGFGGKEDSALEIGARAGILALKAQKPVYLEYTRSETFIAHAKRHPCIVEHRLGAKRDGSLTAVQARIILDKGAYVSLGGIAPPVNGVTMRTAVYAAGPYRVPHVHIDSYSVFTNQTYTGAMRGFGAPQVHFAVESQMDELAARLGMDPLELRLRNGLEEGAETITGQKLESGVGLRQRIAKAREASGWDEPVKAGNGSKRRGRGCAAFYFGTGVPLLMEGAGANLYVQDDGSVQVGVGTVEIGQGSQTVFAQIAAEELGARLEDVYVLPTDTYSAPDSGPTVASRSTTMVGNAVLRAASQVKEVLLEVAAERLGVGLSDVELKDGVARVRSDPERTLPFKEVARAALYSGRRTFGQAWWKPPTPTFDAETGQGSPFHAYTFGVQVAEVEVDTETGQVEVVSVTAATDIGKAINPANVEGQIQGGISMGMGYALLEEFVISDGYPATQSLEAYTIPTSADMPEIECIIVEEKNELGPFGAKGTGEPPCVPTAPAIANAIKNAVGVRVRELPMTPERILAALNEHRRGGTD